MSNVTDIIMVVSQFDGIDDSGAMMPTIDQLDNFTECQLRPVSRVAGGDKHKHMRCDVFMAAINHLDVLGFLKCFYSIEWDSPECVQLMIKQEQEDIFTAHVPLSKEQVKRLLEYTELLGVCP